MSFLTLIRQGSEQVSRLCRESTDDIEDAFDNVANLVAFGIGASVKRCLFLRRAKYIEWEIFAWECEFVVGEAASEQAFDEVVNASRGVTDGKTLDGFPTLC